MERDDLVFAVLEESTKNAKITINGINFLEEELFDRLTCDEYIMSIKTPLRYKQYERYTKLTYKKKTNRGRKKKIAKIEKGNKGFGTCIQFEIVMLSIKPLDINARYFDKATVIGQNMLYPEEWKIKLFRNGTITIAGVKKDKKKNYEETIKYFINMLKKYLNFTDDDIEYEKTKLNNYKTELMHCSIDIYRLEKFFIKYFKNICYISINKLIKNIKTPLLVDFDDFTWGKIDKINKNKIKLDSEAMFMKSLNSNDKKIAKISKENFMLKIETLDMEQIYITITIYVKILREYINIDNKYFETSIENIIYFMAYDEIKILIENLLIEKDISISRFLYVSNKFSALSIYFNIYNNGEKNEPVAKIFPSGKINIDGCNDPKNAPIIFEWIKKLLNTNKKLTWSIETWGMDCHLDTEFSMSDSDIE